MILVTGAATLLATYWNMTRLLNCNQTGASGKAKSAGKTPKKR